MNEGNGLEKLFEKLDSLFKEDTNILALLAYEKFENYVRHDIDLPEPVKAYRVLKSANISSENERFVRATVSELTLDSMSKQLKKVMKDFESSENASASAIVKIKKEPDVSYTEARKEDNNCTQGIQEATNDD